MGNKNGKSSCNPVGADVARGGAANGPAAVYAIRKWDEWLELVPQVLQQWTISLCQLYHQEMLLSKFSGMQLSRHQWLLQEFWK